jgi:hypothetical protein
METLIDEYSQSPRDMVYHELDTSESFRFLECGGSNWAMS